MIPCTFSTAWTLEMAVCINLLYAVFVSSLGLLLIYSHDSLAFRVGSDWRADAIVRIQVSILCISTSLGIAQHLFPQAFLLVAYLGAVTAAGIQMIELDAADQAGWERRYNGANILLAGYGSCLLMLLMRMWHNHQIKLRTITIGRPRHLEIFSQALQSADRYRCWPCGGLVCCWVESSLRSSCVDGRTVNT